MHLRPATHVDVTITAQLREARILRGEAMFDVRHDRARPFCVSTAAGAVAEDVGTKFAVSLGASTTFSVVEGQVALNAAAHACATALPLSDRTSSAEAATLKAGDRAEIIPTQAAAIRRRPFEPSEMTRLRAWLPQLQLTGHTLADAIDQFNRYNCQQLRLADPKIAILHVAGNWDATAPEEFLAALDAAYHIHTSAPVDAGCGIEPITLQQR
jgi:transmembrane sensor